MTDVNQIPPSRIFLSYRREDAGYAAGWLFDRLADHFGVSEVFKDIESIAPGEDFAEKIGAGVRSCTVLLAVIGSRWLKIVKSDGTRRIDDPGDFVRLEIETALECEIPVIPLLVDGALMPAAIELPTALRLLARRNAIEINAGTFGSDFARLRRALDRILEHSHAGERAGKASSEARRSPHRNQVRSQMHVIGYGRRVRDVSDRVTLNIHPAIPLPADAPPDLSDELPLYVRRDIDTDVRDWIRRRQTSGGLLLIVGPAAAGKTRLLSEALMAELPEWQLLRPTAPQVNEFVQAKTDLSRSVLWLNELQGFFVGEPLLATTVESLLAGDHGPVMLAATIRDDEYDWLLGITTADAREMNMNTTAILRIPALWSGRSTGTERAVRFDLPARLSAAELTRASAAAARDPRLRIAVTYAQDGDVIPALACAPELIRRWRGHGDRPGQALVTGAVVARRCGYPEPIPQATIAVVALAHLSAHEAAPDNPDWITSALEWAQKPVVGSGQIAAIRAVRTRPGAIDGYRVSDILLQASQDEADPDIESMLTQEAIWRIVLDHAPKTAAAEIALSAYRSGMQSVARDVWHLAAGDGDGVAARHLGLLYWDQHDDRQAENWLRRAAELQAPGANVSLAVWLWHHDRTVEAKQVATRAARFGDTGAMAALGRYTRDRRQWTRKAAELGSVVAMANLAYQLARHGDYSEAEQWALKAAQAGLPGAMDTLGLIYEYQADNVAALQWYQKGAERGYADALANPSKLHPYRGEAADDGIANSMLHLAELLSKTENHSEANTWYRRGAEIGDSRAAAALAAKCDSVGDAVAAIRWREQSATMARTNLERNRTSLRAAYGPSAIQRHVAIMIAHADDLAAHGRLLEAQTWYAQAENFSAASESF
jgi:TPR repeat protein